MEIRIGQKKFAKPSKILNIFFYFSLTLLFFSIISFFVLDHFLRQTKEEVVNLETKILHLQADPEKLALKREVSNYQKKIVHFSFLIGQQLENSRFFEEFEKIVHPKVWFSEISLNSREGMATLSGQAQNFEALEQQLFIIRNTDWIKNFNLGAVSMEEAKIDFGLSIFFDPKFLND